MTDFTKAEKLNREATRHIAGGVVSINRKVDPPIVFERAYGSRLVDVDGNEYIDYHAAFAPYLFGHNNPEINDAVRAALDHGWSLMGSGTTRWEIRLAGLLREAVPSLDLLQITNTGSEATYSAIRLSRAYTERDHIIVMLGGYNGSHNEVARAVMPPLDAIGPRAVAGEYPFLPLSAGIPDASQKLVHTVNFNDIDSVEAVMKAYPIACVITEPVLMNIGICPPEPGYLGALRKSCDSHGAVLVFDEVKTGFRSALGGYQSICGVIPDLSVFGKAVANGYPLGVIGGRREIMEQIGSPTPGKSVLMAGTYNAHPVPTAAAIAAIEKLLHEGEVLYAGLESLGARMQAGLDDIMKDAGITAAVSRLGSAFCLYFSDHVPVDWHDILENHNFDLDTRYRRGLVANGVYHFPLPCKQGSISTAHTEADIDRTLEITREVVKKL